MTLTRWSPSGCMMGCWSTKAPAAPELAVRAAAVVAVVTAVLRRQALAMPAVAVQVLSVSETGAASPRAAARSTRPARPQPRRAAAVLARTQQGHRRRRVLAAMARQRP